MAQCFSPVTQPTTCVGFSQPTSCHPMGTVCQEAGNMLTLAITTTMSKHVLCFSCSLRASMKLL